MIESHRGNMPRIDPSAFVHPSAVLIGEVEIGAEASVWPNATLRGDDGRIEIGPRTSIQDGTVVHATDGISTTVVGACVTVGHNVTLHGAQVEDHCIIGMGSILLDNARVGAYSLIGAGTLITQRVEIPPRSLVLGSPGKVVREVTQDELEWIEYSWQRYVEHAREHGHSDD